MTSRFIKVGLKERGVKANVYATVKYGFKVQPTSENYIKGGFSAVEMALIRDFLYSIKALDIQSYLTGSIPTLFINSHGTEVYFKD